jgi:hypothetical protein
MALKKNRESMIIKEELRVGVDLEHKRVLVTQISTNVQVHVKIVLQGYLFTTLYIFFSLTRNGRK